MGLLRALPSGEPRAMGGCESVRSACNRFFPFFRKATQGEKADDGVPARVAAEHRGAFESGGRTGWDSRSPRAVILRGPGSEGASRRGRLGDAEETLPLRERLDHRARARATHRLQPGGGGARGARPGSWPPTSVTWCSSSAGWTPTTTRAHRAYLSLVRRRTAAVPAVVLNKADIRADAAARAAGIEDRCPGVTCARGVRRLRSEGTPEIRALHPAGAHGAFGRGPSGAGKSTLVNALLGEERMATGAVRAGDGRGCHVTTHRQLALLPGGGMVLDTPACVELKLYRRGGASATAFPDIEELAGRCRYRTAATVRAGLRGEGARRGREAVGGPPGELPEAGPGSAVHGVAPQRAPEAEDPKGCGGSFTTRRRLRRWKRGE